MIDLMHLEKYKENNRIEAKKALGGFPNSLWETYSAFANTLGGVILLGVEENADKSLHALDLPNPEGLVREFWNQVNNQKKVSANILSDKDVRIHDIDGKRIVAIEVPRAQRTDKPIYINGDLFQGTYRRNGDGDYKCTKEEVHSMVRDASVKTQDMLVLDNMGLDVIDYDTVRRYRLRMKIYRPSHVWEMLGDAEFLYKLGALGRGEDGQLYPTAAGLLMFGFEYEIVKEYPYYFLDYREELDPKTRWTDRIISSSGEWSGNIFDFYFKVYNKIAQDVKVPFKLEGGDRIDDTPVHKALREVLANCLINADYYGRQGIVIIKRRNEITFSNPGGFRIDVDIAKSGGVSDPRNSILMKMFTLVDIGERAGSGLPNIYSVWEKQDWGVPQITETFEPSRIKLFLDVTPKDEKEDGESGDKRAAIKSGDKKQAIKANDKKQATKSGDKKRSTKSGDKKVAIKSNAHKHAIIEYLTDGTTAKSAELARLVGVKSSRVKVLLRELIASGVVVSEGANRNRIYRLK